MSEFKGTKGKWEMSIPDESNGFAYINGGDIVIYGNETKYVGTVTKETEANAKLIACAPEMLELLIEVGKRHQGGHSEIGFKIKDLIKKVTE